MKIHLVLLACFATSCYSSKNFIVKKIKPEEPEPLCKFQGQFLLHGENRCKYIRCTYGPAQVPENGAEDQYKVFYGVERNCPYGTAVSRNFYKERGYGYRQDDGFMLDENRLCTERIARFHGHAENMYYNQCLVEAPRYLPYLSPQMFPILYPGQNQVPGRYPMLPNAYVSSTFNGGPYAGIIQFPYGYKPTTPQKAKTAEYEEPKTEAPVKEESYRSDEQAPVEEDYQAQEKEAEDAPAENEQGYPVLEKVQSSIEEEQQEGEEEENQEEKQEEQQEETRVEQTVHDAPPRLQQTDYSYPPGEEGNDGDGGN